MKFEIEIAIYVLKSVFQFCSAISGICFQIERSILTATHTLRSENLHECKGRAGYSNSISLNPTKECLIYSSFANCFLFSFLQRRFICQRKQYVLEVCLLVASA